MTDAKRQVAADQLRANGFEMEAQWLEHPELVVSWFHSSMRMVKIMADRDMAHEIVDLCARWVPATPREKR